MKKLIDFSKYSSIKIGALKEVLILTPDNYDNHIIIGKATNTLITPNARNLAVLDEKFKFIEIKNSLLYVGAKTNNRILYNFCKKHNIKGFEFLNKLPGTIGGSIKMNAGVKEYEISNNLIAIQTQKGVVEKKDLHFSYRNSDIKDVIFSAVFNIEKGFDYNLDTKLKQLRSNQPKAPSLGSVFKNPKDDYAARLIEKAGLKGLRIGGVKISEIHANFFINVGGGSCEDMIKLIEITKKEVYEKFGVLLEEEIKII